MERLRVSLEGPRGGQLSRVFSFKGSSARLYDLSPGEREVLTDLAAQLSEAAGMDATDIRKAADWHMQHFELDAVVFPE